MAFVVEDGTGKADANCYVSVSEFKAYHVDNGNAAAALLSDADIQTAGVRTTKAIDAVGLRRFVGTKLTAAQALAWPREDGVDVYGFDIDSDVVPIYVKRACYEGMLVEAAAVGALSPSLEHGGMIKRERVEGAVDISYADGAPRGIVYSAFVNALAPVLASNGLTVVRV
jgi:hypothetical protein